MNKPVAELVLEQMAVGDASSLRVKWLTDSYPPVGTQLQTHPVKELTDEEIAKVVYELNQKANTPERWVTAMQIGAETIIQLRDELRKAQEK